MPDPANAELLELLIDDAFSVLQHDADDTKAAEQYEREQLRKKFAARLRASPRSDEVRGECAAMADRAANSDIEYANKHPDEWQTYVELFVDLNQPRCHWPLTTPVRVILR